MNTPEHLFGVYDFGSRTYQSFAAMSVQLRPRYSVRFDDRAVNPIQIAPDSFTTNLINPANVLQFYSMSGTGMLKRSHGVNATLFKNRQYTQLLHLNRTVLASRPNHLAFAAAFLYTDRVVIFDRSGAIKFQVSGPNGIHPTFAVGKHDQHFIHAPQTRWAYVDVDASNKFIYALFSGRSYREAGSEAAFSDGLDIFTWKGSYVGSYHLAQRVNAIAVDPMTGRLFGARALPFPCVLEFAAVEKKAD